MPCDAVHSQDCGREKGCKMIISVQPIKVEPLDSVGNIFVGPVVFSRTTDADRYGRKPNGTEDQGRKDEND